MQPKVNCENCQGCDCECICSTVCGAEELEKILSGPDGQPVPDDKTAVFTVCPNVFKILCTDFENSDVPFELDLRSQEFSRMTLSDDVAGKIRELLVKYEQAYQNKEGTNVTE